MKTKFIITALVLLSVLFYSCDDYLDILPKGQENSENYFNTADDYNNALVGVYDLLSTTYLNVILGEIASDNSFAGGENPTDVLDWQQIDDMTHNPDNSELRKLFQWMYAGISRANYIIEYQDKIDFEGKDQVIAETLFLRSYFYFELVKYFGDVPLYTDGRLSYEGAQSINRTPKAEVYAQLEADLTTAIASLPWEQTQNGRVTKGAALSLLGKMYVYQEKFDQAASTLEQVITSQQYALVDNFGSIFLPAGENGSESIFEVQYFGQEGAGFGCFQCAEGNIMVGFSGPRFRTGDYSPYADGYSFNTINPDLVSAYDDNDARKAATIFDIDAFVAEKAKTVPTEKVPTYQVGNEHTGYFNMKYIPREEGNAGDQHLTHSNNYRAIRYADVLLLAAEANNRGGINDAKALEYLNMVRSRAGLDDVTVTGQALTEAIWSERRLELAGEGHRFFDQVRTGQTSTIPGFTSGKNEVFPIPRVEIELAGNRWDQNPGY